MLRVIFGITCLALITSSCDDSYSNDQTLQQQTMQKKPVVTMIPVIDSTENQYSWNLSNELTSLIHYRLSQKELYLVDLSEVRAKTKILLDAQNPFGSDISWVKKAFQGHEFVAFLELVDHEEVLRQDRYQKTDPQSCAADLEMTMRVRVLDLRGKETKVILQELMHYSHFIPRQYTSKNFNQVSWKEEDYNLSPLGIAHAEFTKEITCRLEEYIRLHASL